MGQYYFTINFVLVWNVNRLLTPPPPSHLLPTVASAPRPPPSPFQPVGGRWGEETADISD